MDQLLSSRSVYDGEEGKRTDLASSLPPFLLREELLPHLKGTGRRAVVLAEEWHTVDAVLNLDRLLRHAGLRHLVHIFWNANNTFGFHRVDWRRLGLPDDEVLSTTCGVPLRHPSDEGRSAKP
jgi:hypothetical protein